MPLSQPLTTDRVLAAQAGAAAGAIGTYVFARIASNVTFGTTVAGSSLFPTAGAYSATKGTGSLDTATFTLGSALTGTWRAMATQTSGASGSVDMSIAGATLFLRIA